MKFLNIIELLGVFIHLFYFMENELFSKIRKERGREREEKKVDNIHQHTATLHVNDVNALHQFDTSIS